MRKCPHCNGKGAIKEEISFDELMSVSTPNHPAPKDVCDICGGFKPFCKHKKDQ